jgi:hypothetical protein
MLMESDFHYFYFERCNDRLFSVAATIPDAPATAAHDAIASTAFLPQASNPTRPILRH